MVRLKGSSRQKAESGLEVSIPYGAIKRRLHFYRKEEIKISIPYGAIKSSSLIAFISKLSHFNSLWCD